MPTSDANDYIEQASVLMKDGQYQEAIPLYESALASLERTYGEDQPELAQCLEELGQAYEAGARLTDALRIHTRRLRLGEAVLGQADPAVVETLFKLTQINETLGRPGDALIFCQRALQSAKQCMPQDSPLSQQIIERYRYLNILAGTPPQAQEEATWQFGDQSNSYKKAVEADISTSQKASSQAELPDDLQGESGGSNLPLPSPIKSTRSRGIRDGVREGAREEGKKRVTIGQLAKDFAIPTLALATVLALVGFLVLHSGAGQKASLPPAQKGSLPLAQNPTKTAIYSRYRTADDNKEVRLLGNNLALLVTANSAVELPYVETTPDWSGLTSAMVSSVQEKQIWAEKKESEIRTEDGTAYYSADGPEFLVIAKMGRLAGFAQAYFLRCGEYPKTVSSDMISQFAFQNPLDGKEAAIQIKTLMDKSSDGVDAKASLDKGLMSGDETANTPCKITCYAIVQVKSDARGRELKATKFFVRGCDRGGILLGSGQAGQTYVITASDAYLMPLDAEAQAPPQVHGRSQRKGQAHAKVSPKPKESHSIVPLVSKEKPKKTTRLWIIANPPCPIRLIHYGLPLLLLGLALAAFLRSQMAGVDMKGRTLSSGSGQALILAAICLGLSLLALVAQIVIFS